MNVPSPAIGRYLGGYFVKILKMYLVGIWVGELRVNGNSNQKVIKMDPAGPC